MFIFRCKNNCINITVLLIFVLLLLSPLLIKQQLIIMAERIISFFTLQDDGANGEEKLLSHLGASAADFEPYTPIML